MQKLNIPIDQETSAVAELRMPRNPMGPIDFTNDVPVYRVIVTNEKDRTYLGCSTWTSFAQEKGFRAGGRLWVYPYEENHPRFYVTYNGNMI